MNKENIQVSFTEKELIECITFLQNANYSQVEYTGEEDQDCTDLLAKLNLIWRNYK